MTRTLKDFTVGELNAYIVWNQKLSDRTLPKEEHDHARSELDKLFRRGPFAELHLLKDELDDVKYRLAVLEEYVLDTDGLLDEGHPSVITSPTPLASAPVDASAAPASDLPPGCSESPKLFKPSGPTPRPPVRADCGNTFQNKDSAKVVKDSQDQTAPVDAPSAPETRGRKKLRFHPEKDANKAWHVLDREADGYTYHGPYKTRREAKEMADTLNGIPNPGAPGSYAVAPEQGAEANNSTSEQTPQTEGEKVEFDPLADI